MMPRFSTGCLAAALLAAPLATPGAQINTPAALRTVFVSAVDGKGASPADLGAADFVVKEDGRVRPVTRAAVSAVPMTVTLMIDDSGLGLQSIREGAAAFVTRLRGLASIAIITTGGRNVGVLDYTDSTAAQMAVINRIYARNVTGAFLIDGIVEATRTFEKREAVRPVIVSIGIEGVDFSGARPDEVMSSLLRSRAQLYMVRIGHPEMGQSNPREMLRGESLADEMTRFNAILGQAPGRTGGRIQQLSSHVGIPRLMEQIASELAGQYEVTYTTPNVNGVEVKLEVSTPRRGVKVRAPERVGRPR